MQQFQKTKLDNGYPQESFFIMTNIWLPERNMWPVLSKMQLPQLESEHRNCLLAPVRTNI